MAKKDQVKRGRLVYNRAKTNTIFSVKIEPEAQALINKYQGKTYLLKFFEGKQTAQVKKERSTPLYKDITDRTNRALKKIAQGLNTEGEFDTQLSTYYARHSLGTIASKLDIPHDVIREALGHSRTVTDVYINFYTPKIDASNRLIINHVLKFVRQADNFIL